MTGNICGKTRWRSLHVQQFKKNATKLIFRWHLTLKKLAKCLRCWKCNQVEGSFYHQWWTCPRIKVYWRKIHKEIQRVLKEMIPLRPELFLLGIRLRKIKKEDRTAFWYMIAGARMLLAKYWKQKEIPKKRIGGKNSTSSGIRQNYKTDKRATRCKIWRMEQTQKLSQKKMEIKNLSLESK